MRRRLLAFPIVLLGIVGGYVLSADWSTLVDQFSAPVAYSLAGLAFVAFWIVFFAALSPSPDDAPLRMRRRVFYLNGILLPILFIVALLYYRYPFAENAGWLKTALHGMWFGVLGSVAISFKGVSDHPKASDWDEGWWVWYLQRPFMGAVVGVMTYSILQVADPKNPPSIPALAVVAFVFGTQEQRFFNLLYEVAKLVLGTPGETGGVSIDHVAIVGGSIVIVGHGFKPHATVTVNNQTLVGPTVAADGTSITAPFAGTDKDTLDVVVLNPDGTATWVSQKVTSPPAPGTTVTSPPPPSGPPTLSSPPPVGPTGPTTSGAPIAPGGQGSQAPPVSPNA